MRPTFTNRKRPVSPLIAGLIISFGLIGIVLSADRLGDGFIRAGVRTIQANVWSAAVGTLDIIDAHGILSSRRALVQENEALKASIALRDETAERFLSLEAENQALREMAHLADLETGGVTARIVSSFSSSPYGTFVIGAGRRDGITEDSTVLSPGGFIIGTVTSVDPYTSSVQSIFAPGRLIDAKIRDVAISLEGRGGGNGIAIVPRDETVALQDTVSIPGYLGRPAALVGAIESASSSATQKIFVRTPVNLDTLEFVYVIPRQ